MLFYDFQQYPIIERFLPKISSFSYTQELAEPRSFTTYASHTSSLIFMDGGTPFVILNEQQKHIRRPALIVLNNQDICIETHQPGDIHRYHLCLSDVALGGLPPNHLLKASTIHALPDDQAVRNVRRYFQMIRHEYTAHQDFPQKRQLQVCQGLVLSLLGLIMGLIAEEDPQAPPANAAGHLSAEIKQWILEHYKSVHTLADIAGRFHISVYYLSHIMKAKLGDSVMKYITQLKLSEAMHLLADTHRPIAAVAAAAGYQNAKYFMTSFKKYIGITPSEFRLTVQHRHTDAGKRRDPRP